MNLYPEKTHSDCPEYIKASPRYLALMSHDRGLVFEYFKPDTSVNSDKDFFWLCETVDSWELEFPYELENYIKINKDRIFNLISDYKESRSRSNSNFKTLDKCLSYLYSLDNIIYADSSRVRLVPVESGIWITPDSDPFIIHMLNKETGLYEKGRFVKDP